MSQKQPESSSGPNGHEMNDVCAEIAVQYSPLSQHAHSLLSPLVVLAFPTKKYSDRHEKGKEILYYNYGDIVTLEIQCFFFFTCSPEGPDPPLKPLGPSSPFAPFMPCCPRGPGSPSAP